MRKGTRCTIIPDSIDNITYHQACMMVRYGNTLKLPKQVGVSMGNFVFIILHIVAILILAGFVGLFITIPLHLIYKAINKK